ncbi:hypothetical protein, partial [Campylobacter rectus]|uniref:hypothetical protein n=1 Tax=Campylobacter rectus TaxID=203 RepID=UPI001C8A9C22
SNQEAKLVLADDTLPYWDERKSRSLRALFIYAFILSMLCFTSLSLFAYLFFIGSTELKRIFSYHL